MFACLLLHLCFHICGLLLCGGKYLRHLLIVSYDRGLRLLRHVGSSVKTNGGRVYIVYIRSGCLRVCLFGEKHLQCRGGTWRRCIAFRHIHRAVVAGGETRMVESRHHALQRILELRRGGQYVGQVQYIGIVAPCVRQTQHTPYYLFHVHARRLVRQRCQYIRKRTIPSLFEGIDGDDIAHGAIGRHQIHACQFVDIGGLYFYLLFGDMECRQFLAYFVEGLALLGFVLRFGLKQHYRAYVACRVLAGCLLQRALQVQCRVDDLVLVGVVIDNHRQFDHVVAFEFQCVGEANDIAVLLGCGGQVEHY